MNAHPNIFRILAAGALCLLTCALFWPAVDYEFVDVDDSEFVAGNPHVRAGWNSSTIAWAWRESHASNWMPATFLSLALDSSLFGLEPYGYHRTNILLHALSAALLFCACFSLTRHRWRSLLLAALWAAHPLRVESVAWIAERKDVLSAVFGFAALWAYAVATRAQRLRNWILCALLLTLGLLAKAMLVSWPILFLLLDVWPLQRRLSLRQQLREKWPYFVLVVAASVVTFLAQRGGGAVSSLQKLPLDQRLENAVVSYARYLERTVWPHDLAYLYPHPGYIAPRFGWPDGTVLGCGFLLLALSGLALVLARRGRRQFLVGWAWFAVSLLPVLGLVQVGVQSMADRYTYLPHVGLMLAAIFAWPNPRQLAWQRAGVGALLVVIGLCAWRTREQLPVWRDSRALFAHAIVATENNAHANNGLGAYLARAGDIVSARPYLENALRIEPRFESAHVNLAIVLGLTGDAAGALAHYQTALQMSPNSPIVHIGLGNLYSAAGELTRAEEHLRRACTLDPWRWQAHFNLGLVQYRLGRRSEGRASLQRALALDPHNATIAERLRVLEGSGN